MASVQLRRGEVYVVGLQPTHIFCPYCRQRAPLRMKCRNCGKMIEISRVQRGRRPIIVVQEDRFNATFDTVLVIPLTSNLKALRFEGVVEVRKTPENGLREDSVALVFQMRVVSKDLLSGANKLGAVSGEVMRDVEGKVREVLGILEGC